MAIKLNCPDCGERMAFDLATTRVHCKHCGYQPSTGLDQRAAEIRAKGPPPNVTIANERDINPRAVSLFYTAHDALFQGNKTEALLNLKRALEIQPDFLEAHLWVAKVSEDEAVQRDHLGSILAYDPGHMDATRMLLVLNGRLTPGQAARTYHENEPRLQNPEGPVSTHTTTLRCPNCKGDLTIIEATGQVVCRFCGYQGARPAHQDTAGDSLVAALLERKAERVKWVIGERLLRCDECGAERTLSGEQLSARCPFCGSNHVIEQDALGSFEQPEGLIPFRVSREEAGAHIKKQLKRFSERLKSWFDNNKVAAATLNGYYLPFWFFDGMVQISRTTIVTKSSTDRYRPQLEPYQHETLNDAVFDVEVCGVKSPSAELTRGLGNYAPDDAVAYTPELLAKYPAQLYTLDFDQAALEARSLISTVMRAKHKGHETDNVSITVFSNIQQMTFRLLLAPVWIAHLVEEDGDQRTALVNGQTGQVVLGKTERGRH